MVHECLIGLRSENSVGQYSNLMLLSFNQRIIVAGVCQRVFGFVANGYFTDTISSYGSPDQNASNSTFYSKDHDDILHSCRFSEKVLLEALRDCHSGYLSWRLVVSHFSFILVLFTWDRVFINLLITDCTIHQKHRKLQTWLSLLEIYLLHARSEFLLFSLQEAHLY